jgi:glucan phosphorylase
MVDDPSSHAKLRPHQEFGREVASHLPASNLLNLGIEDHARAALAELGQDLDEVLACEEEPGLGNGGLGTAGRVLSRLVGHP